MPRESCPINGFPVVRARVRSPFSMRPGRLLFRRSVKSCRWGGRDRLPEGCAGVISSAKILTCPRWVSLSNENQRENVPVILPFRNEPHIRTPERRSVYKSACLAHYRKPRKQRNEPSSRDCCILSHWKPHYRDKPSRMDAKARSGMPWTSVTILCF